LRHTGNGRYLSSSDEEELFATLRLDRYLQARVDKVLAAVRPGEEDN